MKAKLTFEIKRSDANDEFYVRIVMRNGKQTFTSGETYQRRQGAQRAIDGLVNALHGLDYEVKDLTQSTVTHKRR